MVVRFFDILFSSIAVVLLLPVFIPVILILLLTGEHLVFYKQQRVGKNGKPFGLLKFVTMRKNSEHMGTRDITIQNDPRVLPFGKFLRKTKINELPQLLNILKGDMSVVGPRPLTPKGFSYYSENVKKTITIMRPGLTGVGSIVFRDEESIISKSGEDKVEFYKNVISPYKGELEIWYYNNKSFLMYFKLIALTIFVVLNPRTMAYKRWLKKLPIAPVEIETI